jgi:hypothetical protein
MAKDEAIRNQKVFVRMSAVMALQRLYTAQKRSTMQQGQADDAKALNDARLDVFDKVIETLELPIG